MSSSPPHNHDTRKVHALHLMLMADKPNIDIVRRHNLEDTSLEYLDLFFDSAISSNNEAVDLIELTARYANPREMLLAIGEQVEKVGAGLNGLFVDEEEDEEEEEDTIVEGGANHESDEDQKNLNKVLVRLELTIECYTTVIPRLTLKSPLSTLSHIITSLLETLDHLIQARSFGVIPSKEHVAKLLKGICGMVQSAVKWLEENANEEDSKNGKDLLSRLLCKSIVSFHSQLDLELLETWFKQNFPERIVHKDEGEKDTHLRNEVMDEVVTTLANLGHPTELLYTHLPIPSLTNPYLPVTLLVTIAYLSANDSLTPTTNPIDKLSTSMPLLGSVMNGLAVDAGLTVIWTLINGTKDEKGWMDEGDASMLIELIMPNMAQNPSDIGRYAAHRLIGSIIDRCEAGLTRIMLFDQILSPENPWDNVRVAGISLLRDEVVGGFNQPTDTATILIPSFDSILLSKLFVIPDTGEPRLDEMSIEQLGDSPWLAWLVEIMNLAYLLASRGGNDLPSLQTFEETFLTPVKTLSTRWQTEQMTLQDEDLRNHLITSLFSLNDALTRTTTALTKVTKVTK